jgi:hypothetical protein
MLGIDILVKNYFPTASLNGYPNLVILYSGFHVGQKIEDENDSLEYAWDKERLLESEKI